MPTASSWNGSVDLHADEGRSGVLRSPTMLPIEPEPTRWGFPPADSSDDDLVCLGGDLEPGTILNAYRNGLFPMPVGPRLGKKRLGWWSPDPRGILPLAGLHISRSLRRSLPTFEVRFNTSFREVMQRCGDPRRPHGWITNEFLDAYDHLHGTGWAHSAEVWRNDRLVGGVYGLAIGGLFAGESMFHEETDASKAALVGLVDHLRVQGFTLFDVQWRTDHLATLGVVEISRSDYLARLREALAIPAVF
jgi:leucyl/phenylalanyl-tRNA---protein transferase